MPSPLTEYNPEWETFEGDALEWSGASGDEIFDQSTELELAAELLGVKGEQELDQFLGDLIRKVGSIARSPLGRAIGNGLKGVIKAALPLAGGALGTLAGGPLGAHIGSGLASMAGQAFGLELEGLSQEDRELAAARGFVRFASEAVKTAASASPSHDPATAAEVAIATAAQRSAPGLLRLVRRAPAGGNGHWSHPESQGRHRYQPAADTHIRSAEDTMHDIGRIQLEGDLEMGNYEAEQFEWAGETDAVFSEVEEMELASQLMEVSDEQELDQFLGDLIRRAGRALGGFVNSPAGQAIGGILKGAVRQILPQAAGALGTFIGGPLGAQVGSGLASIASNELGMEAETWNQEDREYEGARHFVRVAADTVRNTMAMGPEAEPMEAAQAGIAQSAQMLAPGLLQSASPPPEEMRRHGGGYRGRWKRHGNKIVLYGV
jgi:uncharacterized protein (DUF697 family)